MKLYQTLPFLGLVSAQINIREHVREFLEDFYTENDDGFIFSVKPYFNLQVSDFGESASFSWSAAGKNYDEYHYKVELDNDNNMYSLEINNSGFLENSFEELRIYNYENKWAQDINIMMDFGTDGLNVNSAANLEFFEKDGSLEMSMERTTDFMIDLAFSENEVQLELELSSNADKHNIQFTRDYRNRLQTYPNGFFVKTGFFDTYDLNTNAKIKFDLSKCEEYISSKTQEGICEIWSSFDIEFNKKPFNINGQILSEGKDLEKSMTFNIKCFPKTALFIARMDKKTKPYVLIINGRDYYNNLEYLSENLYYTVYVQRGLNKGTMGKKLVLRFFGNQAIENHIKPTWNQFIKPFDDYIQQAFKDGDEYYKLFVYSIFYADHFLKEIDDELNCSDLIESTRIESDYFAMTKLASRNIFEGHDLNSALQQLCKAGSKKLTQYFQHRKVSVFMKKVRTYVRKMMHEDGEEWLIENIDDIFG
jgi:hypothetical protein